MTTSQNLYADEEHQFRLTRLQAYQWGTFEGRIDIPISRTGFLFIGASGSGKSTLLDSTMALLIPPKWADFNSAARQQGDRHDRNLLTYVRGAWGKQSDAISGGSTRQYLRAGRTTWSAISHTYTQADVNPVTLVAVFWVIGAGNAIQDVKRAYLIFNRPFSIEELKPFSEAQFERRKLKSLFPDAFIEDEFAGYQARLQSVFGVESDVALKLLAKTQAAKDQEDISRFLRDFMLDPPKTFDLAAQAVEQFGELNEAHRAVVTARRQIGVLRPARNADQLRHEADRRRTFLAEVDVAIEEYHRERRAELLKDRVRSIETQITALKQEHLAAESRRRDEEATYENLNQQRLGAGSRAAELERQISEEEQRKGMVLTKRERASKACAGVGRSLPEGAAEFSELSSAARDRLELAASEEPGSEDRLFSLKREHDQLGEELRNVVREVDAMKAQASNIPSKELSLRRLVAQGVGLRDSDLPFAGELLDVRAEDQRWRGAIERVLRGFGLSMLVSPEHYDRVSRFVNQQHLGWRLVYLQMKSQSPLRTVSERSLPTKLAFKEGPFQAWLRAEVFNRFFHECVDDPKAFRDATHAVTSAGQVKSGARHEKDDRSRVDDVSKWILGSDNRERRDVFEARGAELAQRISALQSSITDLKADRDLERARLMHWHTLAHLEWSEIDIGAVLTRLAKLAERLDEERRANPEILEIEKRLEAQRIVLEAARKTASALQADIVASSKEQSRYDRELQQILSRMLGAEFTPTQREELDRRFTRDGRNVSLESLWDIYNEEARALRTEISVVEAQIAAAKQDMVRAFAEFRATWPAESEGLDDHLDSASDYFSKLQRLEDDGLPKFETRFRELLHEQSDTNLTQLQSQLDQERSQIRRRLDEVNAGLSEAEFNPGTHIAIEVIDRNVEEVRQFRAQIREAIVPMRDSAADAEARFERVKGLIDRLRSQDQRDITWRANVLDVRQHVEFRARELDHAKNEIEVYEGGSGKSGGQRQKLAAICLASALRYQLGGRRGGVPRFGTVFIDEAFSKSDAEFTAAAVAVFKRLGFQPILATPMARVMALEPFIGGAYYVDISDRRVSRGRLIEFLEDDGRLDFGTDERNHIATQEAATTEAD